MVIRRRDPLNCEDSDCNDDSDKDFAADSWRNPVVRAAHSPPASIAESDSEELSPALKYDRHLVGAPLLDSVCAGVRTY